LHAFMLESQPEASPFDPVLALGIAALVFVVVANVPFFARRDRDRIMRRHGFVPVDQPGA
jgi:hypothetical protein